MVAQKYRWDFIGLSTDEKPTPATSDKVVDGSTFYCSDNSKLYVFCKDTWYERKALGTGGGGTTYTAGTGISIADDTISVDTSTIQEKLTAGSNITISDNTIAATDTTYSDFTGTDGTSAGTAGLVPAPATTDAGKFLKADGTWDTAGGGGGDTVYSDKTTSDRSAGGAVYIGNLDSSQVEKPDPTTTDNHVKYFWALPYLNSTIPSSDSINIMGGSCQYGSITIGSNASNSTGSDCVAIGDGATASANYSVAIGNAANIGNNITNSVALGTRAIPTRSGEVNIGNNISAGYNSTKYRVLGGVYDGQDNHDAATVAQGNKLMTAAPTTSDAGVLGQLWTDTTNMHTYQCTAISGDTYTWTQRW